MAGFVWRWLRVKWMWLAGAVVVMCMLLSLRPGAAWASGQSVPLTTRALRQLEPLRETDEIVPTGRVREYRLEIRETRWEIVTGASIDALTFNGTIPGPELRATEGDLFRITVANLSSQPTSIHWHGLHVPNQVDGVAPLTGPAIAPGETVTYEFLANHAGTFMYHAHKLGNEVEEIDRGLYGALIIDPQDPKRQPLFDRDYTLVVSGFIVEEEEAEGTEGETDDMGGSSGMSQAMDHGGMAMEMPESPAESALRQAQPSMGMMEYNYWAINGKAYPETQPLVVRPGERVRVRVINISNLYHPMHLHGHDFRVIAVDGHPVAYPQVMNTLDVGPGRTYDIEFIADNPGTWVFDCHELHHLMNGMEEPGGLIALVKYEQ